MSSSSKRPCLPRAPLGEIGPDEWSYISSFLFRDAFESARDLANMSRACRAWRDAGTWRDWSKAFGFFPLGEQFPAVLIPIMGNARTNGTTELEQRQPNQNYSTSVPWAINRVAAKNFLGLGPTSWRVLRICKYDNSRKAGDKHLYTLGDVLREAASRFVSLAALEKRVLRIALVNARRDRKIRLRGERHVQAADFLRSIGAQALAMDSEIRDYIWEGTGSFVEICEKVRQKSLAKDDEDAREIARVYQELESQQLILAISRAKTRAKKRIQEETLLHVNAFLNSIGGRYDRILNNCTTYIYLLMEGVGTFEELCHAALRNLHAREKEIVKHEGLKYLKNGDDRRICVAKFIRRIRADGLIYDAQVQAYILNGEDTFAEFMNLVLQKKHAKDDLIIQEASAVYRRLMEGRYEEVYVEERVAHEKAGDTRRNHVAALLESIGGRSLIHEKYVQSYILNGGTVDVFRQQVIRTKSAKDREGEQRLLQTGPLFAFF
jgi:hypothetical protein